MLFVRHYCEPCSRSGWSKKSLLNVSIMFFWQCVQHLELSLIFWLFICFGCSLDFFYEVQLWCKIASIKRFIEEHKDEQRTSAVVVGSLIPILACFTLLLRYDLKFSSMDSTLKRAGKNFDKLQPQQERALPKLVAWLCRGVAIQL